MSWKRNPSCWTEACTAGTEASKPLSSRMWPAGVVIRKMPTFLRPTKYTLPATRCGGKSRSQVNISRGTPGLRAHPASAMPSTASDQAARTLLPRIAALYLG
jgi:hypothetical protein